MYPNAINLSNVKDLVEDVINPTGSPASLNINPFLIGLFEKNLENLNPVSILGFLRYDPVKQSIGL